MPAQKTLVPAQRTLQGSSPCPWSLGKAFPREGLGLEWLRGHSEPGQALSPTPGTERSNPGMQHNLEDGMDGERQGWAKAGPGADPGFPRGWAGCWNCWNVAGTAQPRAGATHLPEHLFGCPAVSALSLLS